jgi:hypoxanthine phosphoribosyltransferase
VVYRDVEVCTLADVPGGTWIDYPHELADLITDDPGDPLIKEKSEAVWEVVRQERFAPKEEVAEGEYRLLGAEELTLDALRLGVNIFADKEYHPNFIVALWPGGVAAGLPLHEAYKYKLKKSGEKRPIPDHISLNTLPSRLTYKHNVIGLDYLAERINRDDNVLIVDSTFKDGRLVNDAIARLKEVLRRNLNDGRVRVASVYWNPDDGATWTTPPIVRRPHYWVKKVVGKVIYPHAFHRLRDPRGELAVLNPAVGEVLFGE